jgi:hypothetical protein
MAAPLALLLLLALPATRSVAAAPVPARLDAPEAFLRELEDLKLLALEGQRDWVFAELLVRDGGNGPGSEVWERGREALLWDTGRVGELLDWFAARAAQPGGRADPLATPSILGIEALQDAGRHDAALEMALELERCNPHEHGLRYVELPELALAAGRPLQALEWLASARAPRRHYDCAGSSDQKHERAAQVLAVLVALEPTPATLELLEQVIDGTPAADWEVSSDPQRPPVHWTGVPREIADRARRHLPAHQTMAPLDNPQRRIGALWLELAERLHGIKAMVADLESRDGGVWEKVRASWLVETVEREEGWAGIWRLHFLARGDGSSTNRELEFQCWLRLIAADVRSVPALAQVAVDPRFPERARFELAVRQGEPWAVDRIYAQLSSGNEGDAEEAVALWRSVSAPAALRRLIDLRRAGQVPFGLGDSIYEPLFTRSDLGHWELVDL